jgi:spore coat protein H
LSLTGRGDAASWRAGLEAVFDVPGFLRYLALSQTMVNWDSYGCMSHNYYLYGVPADGGRLTWIPWDLNEALLSTRRACSTAESVLLDEVTEEWPLIRSLLDDEVYAEAYRAELRVGLEGAFAEEQLLERMRRYHELISPFVIGDDGESAPYTHLLREESFEGSIDGAEGLAAHVTTRRAAVIEALE